MSIASKLNGKTLDDVLKIAAQKKLKRGGFEKRIFLEKTYKKIQDNTWIFCFINLIIINFIFE